MAASTSLISRSHASCLSCFDELLKTLQNPPRDLAGTEFSGFAKNEYGRYKVWAGNVGAGHLGRTYRLSLDYRLKDSSFYRDRVIEVLVDLQTTLQRVTSILNGDGIPFELVPDEPELEINESSQPKDLSDESPEEYSDSEDSEIDGNIGAKLREMRKKVESLAKKPGSISRESNASERAQGKPDKPVQPTEIRQASMAIRDIVTSLYKLAMVIRRPMPSDRHTKSTKVNVQHFAEFDQRYVCDKFPQADPEVAARLGRGITRRRQLLKYRELHNEQIQVASNSEPTIPTDLNLPFLRGATNKASSSRLVPSTKATTFVPITPMAMDEAQSVADTASTYNSASSDQEVINIPPRPKGPDGDELEEFECPYCYVLCEIKSSNTWKHHVLRDLEPYMCTFLQCNKPDMMYTSRSDWHAHEVEHRIEWFCNTDGHSAFEIRNDFTTHMVESHGFLKSSDQTTLLLDSFRRPLVIDNDSCPLCKITTKNLEGHVARHLTQLALFAIPQLHYSGEILGLGSTASRDVQVRSSDSERSELENEFDLEPSEAGESEDSDSSLAWRHSHRDSTHVRILDELQKLSAENFARLREVDGKLLTASFSRPCGQEGADVKFSYRLLFPDDYPKGWPTISIDKTPLISDSELQALERGVDRIAKEYASSQLGSIEAIIRFLIGDPDVEQGPARVEHVDGAIKPFDYHVSVVSSVPPIGKDIHSDAESKTPAIGRGGSSSIEPESTPGNPLSVTDQSSTTKEPRQLSEAYGRVHEYGATSGQAYYPRRLSYIGEDDNGTFSFISAVGAALRQSNLDEVSTVEPTYGLSSAKRVLEKPNDSPDAHVQKQYVKNQDSGTQLIPPPCPRSTYSAGHDDWVTLPTCPNLDICPFCFSASIARTAFSGQFIHAVRPSKVEVRCDFGSSAWFRIAWLLIRKRNLQDLGMLIELAKYTETTQPCPGRNVAVREWHSIRDPSTNAPIDNFNVCRACAQNIEVLLPGLKGTFASKPVLPPSWAGSISSSRVCDMSVESPRFLRYFEALESIADASVSRMLPNLPPDVTQFVKLIQKLDTLQPCQRDKELLGQKWYYITQLPEFTICEECFTFEVGPELKAHKAIPMMFGREPRMVLNASCQLYSPRMREILETAVNSNDYQYLANKVRERRAAELAYKQKYKELWTPGRTQEEAQDMIDGMESEPGYFKLTQKWLEVE